MALFWGLVDCPCVQQGVDEVGVFLSWAGGRPRGRTRGGLGRYLLCKGHRYPQRYPTLYCISISQALKYHPASLYISSSAHIATRSSRRRTDLRNTLNRCTPDRKLRLASSVGRSLLLRSVCASTWRSTTLRPRTSRSC